MWLIVGLGNPGDRYRWTPHNLGFHVVDHLATRLSYPPGTPMVEKRFLDYFRRMDSEKKAARGEYMSRAFVTRRVLADEEVMLAKPQTYMNESGRSIRDLVWKTGLPTSRLIVVLDEVALQWGYVRIRDKGSAGGHKGLASIITALDTDAFVRVRMGVGLEGRLSDLTDYVLNPVPKRLQPFVEEFAEQTATVVEGIVKAGVQWAMGMFNKRIPLVSPGQ